MRVAILVAALVAAPLSWAQAQLPMKGVFTAQEACPATQSIRSSGASSFVEPGRSYRIVGKNKQDATFLQIIFGGARRWVDIRCGEATEPAATDPGSPSVATATYVLALSWEAAFCREHADKPECAPSEAKATSLSLHGLWPQPRGKAYCNVDPALVQADRRHDWDSLPEPEMGAATRQRLAAVMPGVQSGLQRHEWIVHGTCSGLSPDAYFNRAAELAEQVNASALSAAFASNIGRPLSSDDLRAALDAAFGSGAGARLTVQCSKGTRERRVEEIQIALAGDVSGASPLADLIRAAAPVPASCPGGVVAAPAE